MPHYVNTALEVLASGYRMLNFARDYYRERFPAQVGDGACGGAVRLFVRNEEKRFAFCKGVPANKQSALERTTKSVTGKDCVRDSSDWSY